MSKKHCWKQLPRQIFDAEVKYQCCCCQLKVTSNTNKAAQQAMVDADDPVFGRPCVRKESFTALIDEILVYE